MQSQVDLGLAGFGTTKTQSYSFDTFGNLSATTGDNSAVTTTNAWDNRLTIFGATYDNAGNLTGLPNRTWTYDAFNQPLQYYVSSPVHTSYHLYNADDERVCLPPRPWRIPPGSSAGQLGTRKR